MKLHSLAIDGFRRVKFARISFSDATFLIGANNTGKSTVFKALEYLLANHKTIPSHEYHSAVDPDTDETKPAVNRIIFEAEFTDLPPDAVTWPGFKGHVFEYEPRFPGDSGRSMTMRKTFELGHDVRIEFRAADDWTLFRDGVPQELLSALPRYLMIPAGRAGRAGDRSNGGVLERTLHRLFDDVRESSENYQRARGYLLRLEEELDPADEDSELGKTVAALNGILSGFLPDSRIHADTRFEGPGTLIGPAFDVTMSSNIRTAVNRQGDGTVRAALFAVLRYYRQWLAGRDDRNHSLLVCFEEPEVYLYPGAANQMRETIYELGTGTSQIVASTHAPTAIDLSQKVPQVLNRMSVAGDGILAEPFMVTRAMRDLNPGDLTHLRMLLETDTGLARMFFTKHVVLVGGDTEEVALVETLKALPHADYLNIVADHEIITARSEAGLVAMSKFLLAMGVGPIIVYDKAPGKEELGHQILNTLNGRGHGVQLHGCIEDEMGFDPSPVDRPFGVYEHTSAWQHRWENVPAPWKGVMREIYGKYITC